MYTSFDIPAGYLTAEPGPNLSSMTDNNSTSEPGPNLHATPQNGGGLEEPGPNIHSPAVSIMRWVVAWAVVIMILALINRTRIGHTLIYYALVLMVFLLLVTQYKWLANVLEPITGPSTDTGYVAPEQADHSWNIPQLAQS